MKTNDSPIDLHHLRAREARLGSRIGKPGYRLLTLLWIGLAAGAVILLVAHSSNLAALLVFAAIICFMLAAWWRDELQNPPVSGDTITDRLSGDVLARLSSSGELTPLNVWDALSSHWQCRFITNRFLLNNQLVEHSLSNDPLDLAAVLDNARGVADKSGSRTIEPGHLAGALLLTSSGIAALLASLKLQTSDVEAVVDWLSRGIASLHQAKPNFGGIGRDWAHGFTPLLGRFGHNVSISIEKNGAHFDWLENSRGVTAMRGAFAQGAPAVALIGETGVGKTSHVYALAQSLLQESHDPNLEHRQIISLNPSMIIAAARHPGELEHIVTMLINEAVHAGHIMLFFDDAGQFFGSGTGSFDASQLLMPALQSRAVQLIFAMTPQDYQKLKRQNNAFASQLLPVTLTDPPEADVMRILEDTTLGLEHAHKVLITYEALKVAYRLSGRYEQEIAYPGKAITLLEQSLSYASQGVVTGDSVGRAIEQMRGIKVGSAAPAESDMLLHLEDKIHERMINQSRAVSVVSAALRRARAGVGSPKRPIGSFLFLGPTGVGKTELAKAVASTYFGNEKSIIRLDMSEYQQPGDVARLLSDGQSDSGSLILSIRQQPFSVILLDEIEKAHPNVLNLLLQLLDEGNLTDSGGRAASFKDTIIIVTSNAGAATIRERVERGEELESFEKVFIDELISSKEFKPELLNRFDEIVLFRPLNPDELAQVVVLMLGDINHTLADQNISVELTNAAIKKIVEAGYDARLGARPMRRTLQRAVEDTLAGKILRQEVRPGSHVKLDVSDLSL